ncbi:MAG TPA: tRNA pseudouridine(38-40) synthase TruA [Dehalococcoidia bacterium]|nr:tRNA pseudouridine(38-40) synthase TruA [Dehalococcoidia bacterium]
MGLEIPRRLAFIVEYDGTRYHGSQFQVGVPTVQGDIESALTKLTGERIRIILAGRTDAGVHAKGQVISFSTFSTLPGQTLVRALNFYLRPDIAVKYANEVENSFNARRDAISREYRYHILNSLTPSPLQQRYAYHVPAELDTDAMNKACRRLVGGHDYASFTGPTERSTVRDVYKADVSREAEMVFFDMVANAFLPRQMRCIAGSLIRVGLGKLTAEELEEILQAKEPGLAAPVVPPHGLCLMKVNYPENTFSGKGS